MTYPGGGPGYPQQGGGPQQPPQPPSGGFPQQQPPHSHQAAPGGQALPQNLPMLLALGVAGIGLVQYFLGFADDASGVGTGTLLLLAGGALAGLSLLPKGPKTLPFAAMFSVLGALEVLDALIGAQVVGAIVIVILILGMLQMLVAVGALLLEYDVVKVPAPKPAPRQAPYGAPQQQYGQQQPYTGPPQFGQAPQQGPVASTGEPSPPFTQQYSSPNPPNTTPPPGQQATTYAPQQGQFFQQPSSEEHKPGTPPGGFGQSS
jgi:hypothetical protein